MTQDKTAILPERLAALPEVQIVKGKGSADGEKVRGCVVEVWGWVRGLPWSDRPSCLHPSLAAL
jgi:hypothetical protein